METDVTLSALLVHDDVDEANRLVSLLRNASYIVDPHYAANTGELNRKIQERNWDMVLAQFTAQSIPAKNILHQIKRLNKDIPVIFILDEFNIADLVEALKMGAADASPMDEDQYLIQIVARTLHNLEQRRKLRYWKRRFSESEDRFESLILSSQDGIAIIQEGAYIHVNSAYARLFGYLDADSMVMLPVFDTIAPGNQAEFKKYLKPLDEHNAWDKEVIRFEGITTDSINFPVQATLSQIDFRGEQALQLLIKKDFLNVQSSSPSPASSTVELLNDVSKISLHAMVEGINSSIRKAVKTGGDALLFYIQVDQYDQLLKEFGIEKTEQGMVQLAHFLDGLTPEKPLFGRIREEAFILILASSDRDKGLALANRLVKEVSSQIFTTDDGSFTCTLSIGITLIGEATGSADEALAACQKAIEELQSDTSSGKLGNGVKFHEPVFDLGSGALSDADILRIGRQLIKKALIDIAFQPLVSLHGLEDEFYEVVMRVSAEAFAEGEIPDDFIQKVFKTEVGRDLDRLVIARALNQLGLKKQQSPNTRLCIHLSLATIEDEKFIPWLQSTIESNHLTPRDLLFQMREFDISRQLGKAASMLDRLHNFGTLTGLTHFGLAINPMTIFGKISVDYVKVDGLLSGKAQKDKAALGALKTLLSELKAAKHKVIVPYVESAAIIPSLWQANVDFIQGFYIQAPTPEMNFDFSQE